MAKKRYSFAFILTVFFYLFIGVFFLFQEPIVVLEKNTPQDLSPISFSIVEPKKITPQPKIEESIVENKIVEKKVVEKKILEKKVPEKKTVEKKVVEKKVLEKKALERKPLPKKVIEKQIVETKIVKKTVDIPLVPQKVAIKEPQQLVSIDKEYLKAQQNQYYETVKQTIDKNKHYPKVALRRGIQGEVKIEFTLSKEGELLSYRIIQGSKIFQKSITKAIASSFPIAPPKDIFTSNLDLKLTLLYKIH